MNQRKQSRGECGFCGREMTKGGLARHLPTCPQRLELVETVNQGPGKKRAILHLIVQDAWSKDFWLHLEMNGNATLEDLDHYLRAIWLECCGHLSRYSIGGWSGDEISKNRKILPVFKPGVELTHIYDFGTSSHTLIKAVTRRKGKPLTEHPIYLMARNNLLIERCVDCEGQAIWYCMDCTIERDEWVTLCDEHEQEHSHENYGGVYPLVNSPRVGMCGYDGPADPPY